VIAVVRQVARCVLLVTLSLQIAAGLSSAAGRVAPECVSHLPTMSSSRAEEILTTQRPFVPRNLDLFYSFDNPAWVDAAPLRAAEGPARSEEEIAQELRSFLRARFPCRASRVADGMGVFDDSVAQAKIPNPTLRAALASLTGTIGEPAIRAILDGPIEGVDFGVVVGYREGLPSRIYAGYAISGATAEDPVRIVFNQRHRFDHFALFAPVLFHEALHVGPIPRPGTPVVGIPEETIAPALDTVVAMQQLLTEPRLARLGTEYARIPFNFSILLRLNSGPPGSAELRLFLPDNDESIFPLVDGPITDFASFFRGYLGFVDLPTPGNDLLAEVLPALAASAAAIPEDPAFDAATLTFLDENQEVLSAQELVAVACILEVVELCA
jgi:hypothetical protein